MVTMNNKNAMNFFENMAKSKDDNPQSVKLAHNTDYTDLDVAFILKFTDKNSNILDIGTGPGLIVNKIFDKVNNIVCVEPFANFTQFIVKSPNIEIINESIFAFDTDKKFDIVTAFGFMQYFNEEESIEIYKKLLKYLKPTGKLIIKNQFGIKEDVIVAGYSEEQKANYFARYGFIEKEKNILEKIGYKNISISDIYPPEANRWDNTHFYAIVAEGQ